jgi:hypothetical protein
MNMKNETTLADLGFTVALEVFDAPYHYLPWNERLACRIVTAFLYCAHVAHALRRR